MVMRTRVKKWGNSLAIRLPEEMAKELDLHDNSAIEIKSTGQEIRVKPSRKSRLTLEDLVNQITPENRYEEIDWGPDVGKEIVEWKP